MKTILTTIAISTLALLGAAPEANARPYRTGGIYISGYRSCGTPIYSERYFSGYDRCGAPVWSVRVVRAPYYRPVPAPCYRPVVRPRYVAPCPPPVYRVPGSYAYAGYSHGRPYLGRSIVVQSDYGR